MTDDDMNKLPKEPSRLSLASAERRRRRSRVGVPNTHKPNPWVESQSQQRSGHWPGSRSGPQFGYPPRKPRDYSSLYPPEDEGYETIPNRSRRSANSLFGKVLSRIALVLLILVALVGGLSLAMSERMGAGQVKMLLILVVVGSGLMVLRRYSFAKILRMVGLWGIIILGLAGLYMTQDHSDFANSPVTNRPVTNNAESVTTGQGGGQEVYIRRAPDGHFYIRTLINDREIRMLVDTGASSIVLSPQDAKKLGLSGLVYNGFAETANGRVRLARTRVKRLQIGDTVLRNVRVAVNSAEMTSSLLGLSALNAFSSFEFRGNELVLRP